MKEMINDTESDKNVPFLLEKLPYIQGSGLRVKCQTFLILGAVLIFLVHELFRYGVEYLDVFLDFGGRSLFDNITCIMVSF